MPRIHPTAIVSHEAVLADDVSIGAFSIIKGEVHIGAGTVIHEHCHVHGRTRIGRDCQIGPTAFVGLPPQHLRANPEVGQLIIGDRVTIRETASIHRSITEGEEHATRVGSDCLIMVAAHVGHDCALGKSVILANAVAMGGHCTVGDQAYIGGAAAIHQFVRIGRLALVGANETVTQEVPPFSAVRFAGLKGYNAVGCRRSGMRRESIHSIRAAFRCLHNHRLTANAILEIQQTLIRTPEIEELLSFIQTSKRGIVPPAARRCKILDPVAD
jgi:UDP-N-acetylglucosamine acyltransferase